MSQLPKCVIPLFKNPFINKPDHQDDGDDDGADDDEFHGIVLEITIWQQIGLCGVLFFRPLQIIALFCRNLRLKTYLTS